ncbi:MAG TPA: DUF542 domain-containing protein [Candidatus Sulfotelmatobacter sp.]|nr:DUF542 domain-containing protein [Candidatus Sulfotelmatobacter sp.]
MNIDQNQSLDALVAQMPGAIPVLEQFGIDYCCDRHQSLAAAAQAAGLSLDEITRCLREAEHSDYSPVSNWTHAPLHALVKHIVDKHHTYCRRELERLAPLINEIFQEQGEKHSELRQIRALFSTLSANMRMHLLKEEQTLFPMIVAIEEARNRQQPLPRLPFGSIRNPITMMGYEHDEAARPVREIRLASSNYQPPANANTTYQEVFRDLREFERDLHQHVYLEDHILFPRVIALEQAAA